MSGQNTSPDEHRYFNIRRINDDDVIFQTMNRANDKVQLENAAARFRGYREIKHGSWTIGGETVTSKVMFVVERAHVHLSIAQAVFLPGFIQLGFDKDLSEADIRLIEEIF